MAAKKAKAGGAAATQEETKEATPAELKQQIADLKKALAAAEGGASNEDLTTKPVLGYWKIRGLAQ